MPIIGEVSFSNIADDHLARIERLGQGRDNVKELISKNPALLDELDGLIRQNLDKVAELGKSGTKKTKVLNVVPTGIDVSADEDDE